MFARYALIGGPHIVNSTSPFIHTQLAERTQQCLTYEVMPLSAAPSNFTDFFNQLRKDEFKGLNVTMPFKEIVFNYLQEVGATFTERAMLAQVINTIRFNADNTIFADNTDGFGLYRDLIENLRWKIHNKKILICGAGGAVRGILGSLLPEKPHSIVIANRTLEKAQRIKNDFAKLGDIRVCAFTELTRDSFDLIINCIAVGHFPPLSKTIVTANTCCYDIVYSHDGKDTMFLNWAKNAGVRHYAEGSGMLVEQAAEAFYVWRNVKPETQSIIKKLHDKK